MANKQIGLVLANPFKKRVFKGKPKGNHPIRPDPIFGL